MEQLTRHKDAKPSTYYTTLGGRRIATARKDGSTWRGTVVGLGFDFGGRRLADVKELAPGHVERLYGDGSEWTLFPVRELRRGMVLGCDSWKEEREVVSVEVDTDAQTVEVELSSKSSRELGFNLDATFFVGEHIRVRVQPEPEASVIVGDVVSFYDCAATVTAVGTERVEFVRQDGTTGRKPVDHDFGVIGHDEQTSGEAPSPQPAEPVTELTEGAPFAFEDGGTANLAMVEAIAEAFVKAHPNWEIMTPTETVEALGCWTGKPKKLSREEQLRRRIGGTDRALRDVAEDRASGLFASEVRRQELRETVERLTEERGRLLSELDGIEVE